MPTRGRRPSLAALVAALLIAASAVRAHSPHDVVHGLELSPTYAVDQTIFAAVTLSEHELLARSTDGGRSWRAIGAGPMIHSFQSFSFSDDFANDGTCFIATFSGGTWRTTDHGETWQHVTAALPSQLCRDVAVSPSFSTDQTVLTSTAAGLYRSLDGGDTWALVTDGVGGSVVALLHTAYGTSGTLFAGREKLFRSLDAGATWQQMATFASPMSEVTTSPAFDVDQQMALCFGRYGGGILASLDGGVTFDPMNTGIADEFVNSLDIADDGAVYACTQIDPCYRAPAIGATWTAFDEGFEVLSDLSPDHYKSVRAVPDHATDTRVFVGGFEGVFVSDDAGATFAQRNLYPVAVLRAVAMSPQHDQDGKVFVGSYGGGVYRLRDGAFEAPVAPGAAPTGVTSSDASAGAPLAPTPLGTQPPAPTTAGSRRWRSTSSGLESLFSTTLQLAPNYSPSTPTVFYSYQGVWRSLDDGASWTEIPTPEDVTVIRALGLAPDHPSDPTMIIGTNGGVGTWRSIDDGASWTELTNGLPPVHSTRAVRYSPFFASDQTVFIATKEDGLFRSVDGGDSFTDITGPVPVGGLVRAFEISPTYAVDTTLFTGTRGDGLWRSTDGGDSWQQLTTGLPPTADLGVESIAVSPRFAIDGTLFIATMANEVYKSTDSGDSWTRASAGLPETASWVIDVSPKFPTDPTVLLSTNDWIWESKDAGATWSPMPSYARVDDLYNEIRYDGFWTNNVFPGNLSFGARTSDTPGATSTFEFYGTDIAWHGVLNPDGGFATVAIDGEVVAIVDTYAPVQTTGELLFALGFDEPGFHEIVITVDGTANPSSSGVVVQSDGFSYHFTVTP